MGKAMESPPCASPLPSLSDSVRTSSDSCLSSAFLPSTSKEPGNWLFNYGIGIHLLESENVKNEKGAINPKDSHISFQCSDLNLLKQRLQGMGIQYVTAVVSERGIHVDQIFFHDPDGYRSRSAIARTSLSSLSPPSPSGFPNPPIRATVTPGALRCSAQ